MIISPFSELQQCADNSSSTVPQLPVLTLLPCTTDNSDIETCYDTRSCYRYINPMIGTAITPDTELHNSVSKTKMCMAETNAELSSSI